MESIKEIEVNSEKNVKTNEEIPKNALYLGLKVKEPLEKFHELIKNSLNKILEEYSGIGDAEELVRNIEEGRFKEEGVYKNPWRYPKDDAKWHITTLFKKGSFNKSHPAYTSFEKGKSVIIEIKAILYVPDKIITSVVFSEAAVENEFPHMTTLLGGYAAKNSNDVCKELFAKGKPLEKEYKKLQKGDLSEEAFIQKLEVKIMGKKEIVYVYKFATPIQFETEMTIFFG